MEKTETFPNERLQLNDYKAVANLIFDEFLRELRTMFLPSGRTGGVAATSARIFSGFGATNFVGGTFRLSQGSGIFPYNDDGILKFGILLGEDTPPYYDIDLSSYPDNDYFVFVRLVYTKSNTENRIFWNPSGIPAEFVSNVVTRLIPSWEYTVQSTILAPPGNGEFVSIFKVNVASGVVSLVQDLRHYFFEGDVAGSYAAEWGTGNDRNVDRALYGVQDFHKFAQALKVQLAEIMGDSWFKQRLLSLKKLADHHFEETATNPGSHKSPLYLGAPGSKQFSLQTDPSVFGLQQVLRIKAEDNPFDAGITFIAMDSGQGNLYLDPKGYGNNLAVGNNFNMRIGGPADPNWLLAKDGSNEYSFSVDADQTEEEIIYRLGSGAIGTTKPNGIHLGNDGGYYLTERTTTIALPLNPLHDLTDPWFRDTSIIGDVFFNNNNKTSNKLGFRIFDLPHLCKLNYIDVMWYQDSISGAGTDLRIYAYKERIGFTAVGPKPGGSLPTDLVQLHLTTPYIEIGTFGTICIQRFTFNESVSNRTFSRFYDNLSLTVVSPNTTALDCFLYWIRANFSYVIAQPYPTSGGAT